MPTPTVRYARISFFQTHCGATAEAAAPLWDRIISRFAILALPVLVINRAYNATMTCFVTR